MTPTKTLTQFELDFEYGLDVIWSKIRTDDEEIVQLENTLAWIDEEESLQLS